MKLDDLLSIQDLREALANKLTYKNMARLTASFKEGRTRGPEPLDAFVQRLDDETERLHALATRLRSRSILATRFAESILRPSVAFEADPAYARLLRRVPEAAGRKGVFLAALLLAALAEKDLGAAKVRRSYDELYHRARPRELRRGEEAFDGIVPVAVVLATAHRKDPDYVRLTRALREGAEEHLGEYERAREVYLVQKRKVLSLVDKIGDRDLARKYHRSSFRTSLPDAMDFGRKVQGRTQVTYEDF
jgi:hypothetical protein